MSLSMSMSRVLLGAKKLANFPILSRNISISAPKQFPIVAAGRNESGTAMQVAFSDGEKFEYPSLFLQDNCTCASCFHESSKSRARLLTDLKVDNGINKVNMEGGNKVKCVWDDGHEAYFSEQWLKTRSFSKDNITKRRTGVRDNPNLVDANHKMYREKYENLLNDSEALNKLLQNFCKNGVVMIEGAPLEVGQVRKLAQKIGYIRPTHYGYEFTVKAERNAVNLAYTSNTLVVHTDLSYYAYPPGTQMLHCIKQFDSPEQEEGGRSHLVDGFNIARQMEAKYPEEYKLLCETPVEFSDVGADFIDFNKIHHTPTFVVDKFTGKVIRICYNNMQLSSIQPVPYEKVQPLYKALKVFTNLCYDPKNLLKFKLKEGQILFFDNWRYLHGREGFDTRLGDRHIEGCYIDWDEIASRLRVLNSAE